MLPNALVVAGTFMFGVMATSFSPFPVLDISQEANNSWIQRMRLNAKLETGRQPRFKDEPWRLRKHKGQRRGVTY